MARRALIYCRISRDPKGDHLGVDRQERDCKNLAATLGWQVVGVEIDNDISAASGRVRPAYERSLTALEQGDADAIIAWHPDRLHRRPVELERFIDLCERRAVAVQTVKAGEIDLSTASGRMVARVVGAMARHEVDQVSSRVKAKKDEIARAGGFSGGPRPFGYESDGVTLRPAEADLMRGAIEELIAGGSMKAIVRQWTDAGVTGTKGKPWTTRNLRVAIMRGARYAGLIERDGEIIAEGSWPAIISRDQLAAVRLVLSSPERRTSQSTARKHLCSGVAIDGPTGRPMVTTKGKIERIYIASGQPAGSATVPVSALDEYVEAIVITRLSQPDAVALTRPTDNSDLAAIRAERDTLAVRRSEAASLFADGKIGADQLSTITSALDKQIGAADATLARENMKAANETAVSGLLAGAGDLTSRWAAIPTETKSRIVAELMSLTIWPMPVGKVEGAVRPRRIFDPERVEITWTR